MIENINTLWVEKFRPKSLDDMVLSDENKKYFSSIKDDIPHLMFIGPPGTGKTTIAKVIVQDILKCQYLYINASDENGIDVIRNKVTDFAQIKSLDNKVKVIILDEADGLSPDAQRALRNTIEEYSIYTRFIFTANYKHKIIPALQSRIQQFDLTPPLNDMFKRVASILVAEKIKVPQEQRTLFSQLVKDCYPDLRKAINTIQKYSITGTLSLPDIKQVNGILQQVNDFIKNKDVLSLRKFLIENEASFQGDYETLMKQYLNFIFQSDCDDIKKRNYVLILSEHIYRSVFALDKEINAFACFLQLEKV